MFRNKTQTMGEHGNLGTRLCLKPSQTKTLKTLRVLLHSSTPSFTMSPHQTPPLPLHPASTCSARSTSAPIDWLPTLKGRNFFEPPCPMLLPTLLFLRLFGCQKIRLLMPRLACCLSLRGVGGVVGGWEGGKSKGEGQWGEGFRWELGECVGEWYWEHVVF